MPIAATIDLEIAPARPLSMPLVPATACAALADRLFDGWEIGVSLALLLGVASLGIRTWRLERYLANNPDIPPNPSDSRG
jgi:hypothetical protein